MMNENLAKKELLIVLKSTLLFGGILFGLHTYFQHFFFKEEILYHPIYSIYTFLVISLVGLFYFIIKAAISKPDTIFTSFAVGSLVKSAIVILFFLPLFFEKPANLNLTVANFFIPYFLFLTFEIYLIIKLFQRLK